MLKETNLRFRWIAFPLAGLLVIGMTTMALYGTGNFVREMPSPASPTTERDYHATKNEYRTTSPLEWLTNEQKQMVENYRPETGAVVPCHRVGLQYLGTDLPYVPIPKSWCNKCTPDGKPVEGEEPNYIFVMGDPDSGTTALHGTLFSSKLVTHLCKHSQSRKETPHGLVTSSNQVCEGHKLVIPDDEWDHRWEENRWPYDFQTDVLDNYEEKWRHDRCFRTDKAPPYSIRIFQMVEDLITVHKHRVAFLILTRSCCARTRGANTYINLYAQQYQYLLDNNIPVLHVRYEDLYRDVKAVERRVNNWAQGCLKVDFSVGYDAVEAFDPDNSSLARMEPVSKYMEGKTLESPSAVRLIPREWLAGLAYFGYELVPRHETAEINPK